MPDDIQSQDPKEESSENRASPERSVSETEKERQRILALLEISEDPSELKKFIEGDIDPAKAALSVLRRIRAASKSQETEFPSPIVGSGLSQAQDALSLAKQWGVI